MRIGDLAKATGVDIETIRYYEVIGLLPKPTRTAGNYRSFEPDQKPDFRFIDKDGPLG